MSTKTQLDTMDTNSSFGHAIQSPDFTTSPRHPQNLLAHADGAHRFGPKEARVPGLILADDGLVQLLGFGSGSVALSWLLWRPPCNMCFTFWGGVSGNKLTIFLGVLVEIPT